MKFLTTILVTISLLAFSITTAFGQSPTAIATATPSATPSVVSSFDVFWPIVAGRTRGDALYFLKTFKEKLRELLLFSNFKKADYNITLSVKRTVEAEKLILENKDFNNAKATLEDAQTKRDRSFDLISKAKAEGKKVDDLINTLNASLEKQEALLVSIKSKAEEQAVGIIDDNINKINSLQNKLVS